MLYQQIKKMEEELAAAQSDLSRISGLLYVNFCKYPNSKGEIVIWSSPAEFKKGTTINNLTEALTFLCKQATDEKED